MTITQRPTDLPVLRNRDAFVVALVASCRAANRWPMHPAVVCSTVMTMVRFGYGDDADGNGVDVVR